MAMPKPERFMRSKLPQLINWLNAEWQGKPGVMAAFEPVHLHILTPPSQSASAQAHNPVWYGQRNPYRQASATQPSSGAAVVTDQPNVARRLDPQSFEFLLAQVPTIESLEFSGWGDPLDNPHLFALLQQAKAFNGIHTTVLSPGLVPKALYRPLFLSSLDVLAINLISHKPSSYGVVTGQSSSVFPTLLRGVEDLVLVKAHYPKTSVAIELRFTVDPLQLEDIPAMIQLGIQLGVDSVRFENHLEGINERTLQQLSRRQAQTDALMAHIASQQYPLRVILPAPITQNTQFSRNCQELYLTLSVTEDLRISPCVRHAVFHTLTTSVWDNHAWNSDEYTWLRRVHNGDANNPEPLPLACQFCPMNASCAE